jgi:hypothetical protein
LAMADACGMLAAAITANVDLASLGETLMTCSMALLEAAGAVMLFIDDHDELTLSTASDDAAEGVGRAAERIARSPARAAIELRRTLVDSLVDARGRWQEFSSAASGLGYRWCCAIPLRTVDRPVGVALVLQGDVRAPFSGPALRLTQSLFDVGASTLHLFGELAVAQKVARQLQTALTTRVVIEQAKGMLAVRAGISPDEAFAALRKFSRDRNLRLRDLAASIVTSGGDVVVTAPRVPASVSA